MGIGIRNVNQSMYTHLIYIILTNQLIDTIKDICVIHGEYVKYIRQPDGTTNITSLHRTLKKKKKKKEKKKKTTVIKFQHSYNIMLNR